MVATSNMLGWTSPISAALGAEPWFDAKSVSNSDIGWVRNAVSHYTQIESGLGIHPDHAMSVTWVRYPTRNTRKDEAKMCGGVPEAGRSR